MGVTLPSIANSSRSVPQRLDDNLARDADNKPSGYARWWKYPTSKSSMRNLIEDAYSARTTRSRLIVNSRARRQRSSPC